jgi:hypothetical protein
MSFAREAGSASAAVVACVIDAAATACATPRSRSNQSIMMRVDSIIA